MDENVVITDKKKIEEIKEALKTTGILTSSPPRLINYLKTQKKYGLVLTKTKHYAIIPLSPHERLTSFLHSYKESKAPDEMPRVLSFS